MSEEKLDARLRRALESGKLHGVVRVLVRIEPQAGEPLLRLISAGMTINCRWGDVVSGRLDAGKLLEVAALPFVVRVECDDGMWSEA